MSKVDNANIEAPDPIVRAQKRELRKMRQHLDVLTKQVVAYLAQVDVLMAMPHSKERDGDFAKLSNALEIANDTARHFGLGIYLRTGKKAK